MWPDVKIFHHHSGVISLIGCFLFSCNDTMCFKASSGVCRPSAAPAGVVFWLSLSQHCVQVAAITCLRCQHRNTVQGDQKSMWRGACVQTSQCSLLMCDSSEKVLAPRRSTSGHSDFLICTLQVNHQSASSLQQFYCFERKCGLLRNYGHNTL